MNKCTIFTILFIWRKTRSHIINHNLIYKTFLTVTDIFRTAKSHHYLSAIYPLNMKLCAKKVNIKTESVHYSNSTFQNKLYKFYHIKVHDLKSFENSLEQKH